MYSLANTLMRLFYYERRDVATVAAIKGNGIYTVTTLGGADIDVTATDTYAVGDQVFIDVTSKTIISKTPPITYSDLAV